MQSLAFVKPQVRFEHGLGMSREGESRVGLVRIFIMYFRIRASAVVEIKSRLVKIKLGLAEIRLGLNLGQAGMR